MRKTLVIAVLSLGADAARAQEDAAEDVAEGPAVDDADQAEARAAWAQDVDGALDQEVATVQESDSYSRIHDVDADLLDEEAAREMIGFDVMDGVR